MVLLLVSSVKTQQVFTLSAVHMAELLHLSSITVTQMIVPMKVFQSLTVQMPFPSLHLFKINVMQTLISVMT